MTCRLEHIHDVPRAVLHRTAPDHILHDVRVLVRIESRTAQRIHGGQVVRITDIVVLHPRKTVLVDTCNLTPRTVKVRRADRELRERPPVARIDRIRRPIKKAAHAPHAARQLIFPVALAAGVILSGRDRRRAAARFVFCTQIAKHSFFLPVAFSHSGARFQNRPALLIYLSTILPPALSVVVVPAKTA